MHLRPANPWRDLSLVVLCALKLLALAGCGSTKSRLATDQLLMSDAVDRTVAQMDFTPLAGRKVFFDTKYIQPIKGYVFVNAEYVISSLRQQLEAAGCYLQDKAEEADFIVEGRVGALGTDVHEITYGMPANQLVADASAVMPNTPRLPMIPELALAKKNDSRGAAKIAVFAYHRESRQPVWQSGVTVATSTAKDAWVFGVGPIRYGTIYDKGWTNVNDSRRELAYSRDHLPEGRMASYYEEANFKFDASRAAAVAQRPTGPTLLDGQSKKLPPPSQTTPAGGQPPTGAGPGNAGPGGAPANSLRPETGAAGQSLYRASQWPLDRGANPAPRPAAPAKPGPGPVGPPVLQPDAYPFPPGQPQLGPGQTPLTSDSFPVPPVQGMLLTDPPQLTSDNLPAPPRQGIIVTDQPQFSSDRYPQPGPQSENFQPPAAMPMIMPFLLQ